MEDEELAKSLLVTQQPVNIKISSGFGSNDTGASASGVTAVLLLSALVTACSAFAGGFVAGYSAPAESGIIADLGLSVAEIPAIALGSILIEKFGRRTLLMVSVTGECFGCFLTGLSFILQNLNWWMDATPTLMLSGIVVFEVSYSLGIGSISWIVISEIFPINIKGSAGSICNAVNWFCTWLVSFTFNFLVEWSPAGTFFIYGSMSCLGVLFIAKLVPETKGRTLEEIQASLTHILQ